MPCVAYAQDIRVKETLAGLIEDTVDQTGYSINIPPNEMSEKSVNINRINGISVCDPEIKQNVIELQKAFAKDQRLHQTISSYGVYLNSKGSIKYLSGDNPKIKKLIGECKYLYVSVR